jgi:hypothetical protein
MHYIEYLPCMVGEINFGARIILEKFLPWLIKYECLALNLSWLVFLQLLSRLPFCFVFYLFIIIII